MNRFSSRDYSQFKVIWEQTHWGNPHLEVFCTGKTLSRGTMLVDAPLSIHFSYLHVNWSLIGECFNSAYFCPLTLPYQNCGSKKNVFGGWILFWKCDGFDRPGHARFLQCTNTDKPWIVEENLTDVLSFSELARRFLPQLLWLLQAKVLYPWKCPQLCVFQAKYGSKVDSAVFNQDGIPGDF